MKQPQLSTDYNLKIFKTILCLETVYNFEILSKNENV